ncbi:MAG: 3-dehydroquinate synthase, partial [Acutalibacteraceae bacterium]
THGQAVAIGMVLITLASEDKGFTKKGTADKIIEICKKYGLPISDIHSKKEIALSCFGDKKSRGESISLVLISEIGSTFVEKIPYSDLENFITI